MRKYQTTSLPEYEVMVARILAVLKVVCPFCRPPQIHVATRYMNLRLVILVMSVKFES